MSKIVELKSKKTVDPKKQASKLKWSYRLSTFGLCSMLIFNSMRVIFTESGLEGAVKMAGEVQVPSFIAIFVVPIGSLLASILILSDKWQTLRIFAYAWTLFYFFMELLLVINVSNNAQILWSLNTLLTWTGAYYWNLKRLAKNQSEANHA
jgi:hypothetical protein